MMDRTNRRPYRFANAVNGPYVEVLCPRVVQSLWLDPGSFRLLRRQYDGFAMTPKGAAPISERNRRDSV
jgi:hypothetical protein